MPNKNVMTVAQAPHAVNIVYQKAALKTLHKFIVHAGWGQNYQLPLHSGDTMKWSRWAALLAQTTPLNEVEDPAPILATRTDLTCQMKEYGAWMKITRWLQMTGLGATQAQITELLSEQMTLSIDTLVRDVIAGSSSNTTCSNGSGTATLPNKTDIDAIVKTLYTAGAKTIASRMGAATGQGTSPGAAAYIGIMHTDGMNRLKAVAGFLAVKNYASPGAAYPYEFGQTGMVRWILTNNGYTVSTNYYAPIMGQQSYGEVHMKEGVNPLIYKSPEQSPSPLNRYGTLGWNSPFACRILNDLLIHTMVHTV
jgi:N4-gp56 family major capsid protein